MGVHLSERVRALRLQRGWSLEHLSGMCGVSRSMLSQIERSEANPTVGVAIAIATALGVTLDELVAPPEKRTALQLIAADDPHYVYRSDEYCRIRTLSPLTPDRRLEFYEITLQPAGALRSAPHFSGTREYLTVQRGRVRVESADHSAELAAGDSITFPADVPHAIINATQKVALAYLIDVMP